MNIFKAARLGGGKATLPGSGVRCVYISKRDDRNYYGFVWSDNIFRDMTGAELESNDWIPYIPNEESPKKQVEILTIYYETFSKYNLAGLSPEEINKILIKPYGLPWKTSRDILLGKLPGTSADWFKNHT